MSKRSYDPEAARQHVTEARERLEDAVAALMSQGGWEAYLRFQSRFHHYSWGNSMLIAQQFPGATYVKGFKSWQDLGRVVRKGETGIRILAPSPWKRVEEDEQGNEVERGGMSFRVVSVFDVSQTEPIEGAKNVFDPDSVVSPLTGRQEEGDALEAARLFDIVREYNEEAGREIQVGGDHPLKDMANGAFSPTLNRIWINERGLVPMLATFIHETAHALTYEEVNKADPKEGYKLGEVCVEAVSFIVMDYFGFEAIVPSSEYVTHYLKGDSAAFKKVLTAIQKTAHGLIEYMANAETVEFVEEEAA